MEIGMIGLGRMGGNMARRLRDRGYEVAGFDSDPEQTCEVASNLRWSAGSIGELVKILPPRRVVWTMVPPGRATDEVVDKLATHLTSGDIVLDGSDSYYKDSIRRAERLKEKGINFLDVGVSGGIWGLAEGYCLMAGGEKDVYSEVEEVFKALSAEEGSALVGPTGAGHFARMVHDGMMCGMMEAYGEGFELLEASPFDLDPRRLTALWLHGSAIRSWLLNLCTRIFGNDPKLASIKGWTEDSGEERMTVSEAMERGIPTPAIAASLFTRYRSWETDDLASKVVAALRHESGGYKVVEAFPDLSSPFASEEEAA